MVDWFYRYKLAVLTIFSWLFFSIYLGFVYFPDYEKESANFEQHFQGLEKSLDDYLLKQEKVIQSAGQQNIWTLIDPTANPFNLHVYRNDSLIFWNTNQVPVLRFADIHFPSEGIIHLQNGWYYCKSKEIGKLVICASFLIKNDFPYENNDLKNNFSKLIDFPFDAHISFEQDSKHAIHSLNGAFLFSAIPSVSHSISEAHSHILLVILLIALICSFGLLFKAIAVQSPIRKIVWLLAVLVLRMASLKFSWFEILKGSKSNQVTMTHFNAFIPSFSELLIHVVCFIFLIMLLINLFKETMNRRFWVLIAFLLSIPLAFLITFLIRGIIQYSTINLATDRLLSFDFYSFISLIIIGSLYYAFFKYVSELLILNRQLGNHAKTLVIVTIVFVILIVLLSFFIAIPFYIVCLYGLIVLVILWSTNKTPKRYQLGVDLLTLSLFSMLAALSISYFKSEKERDERAIFAARIANEQEVNTEIEYHKISQKIVNDHFIQKLINSPKRLSLPDFEDRLERRIFNGYWERYDMNFYLFDLDGQSLISEDTNSQITYFSDLEAVITKHGIPSVIDSNIYYISSHVGQYSYIVKQELMGRDSAKFLLFCTFKSKKIPEEIGFPRLLIPSKAQILEPLENYSVAKYLNGKLATKYGEYNFPTSIASVKNWPRESSQVHYANIDGFNHFILDESKDDLIIISSKNTTWLELLTEFSFLFTLFGACLTPFLIRNQYRRANKTLTLSIKIQFVLVSIVFFSMLMSGWGSGVFVQNQYNDFSNLVLKDKLSSINFQLLENLGNKDRLNIVEDRDYLDFLTQHISKLFATDINLYDKEGFMLSSSRPKVFNLGLISEQMDPSALAAFLKKNKSDFAHEELIGNLSYTSAYLPFYNNNRKLMAFLNLQQFGQQKELEHQIQRFLASVMNVFVLMLAISIVLAIFISDWLTAPLRSLQDNFTSIRFGKLNNPIVYQKMDEIGLLVKAYNEKLVELELAAEQLVINERETAWREMARQVAHEINNPLTPMKLGIQQLLRVYDPTNPESEKKLQQVAQSMIEQIDSLTKIANEFSNFAKMPQENKIELDLLPLLNNVIDFFNQDAKADFILESKLKKLIVKADKDQMVRLFNNLIKNAIQSIPPEQKGLITIKLSEANTFYCIEIQDNGSGIPQSMRPTIFVPYFTTKSTGTGLGLAMVKQIVEHHGGTIYFETKESVGTSFFLKFPKSN